MSARRSLLPVEITDLLARVPRAYLRDLATDLAWAALIAPRRSDVLYQVVMEWQATLEEIELSDPSILPIRVLKSQRLL
ncbi:MAG: hypothetical protein ISS49_17330 [Anaerolineae bacterium]|nr:hypothetical protein [Anaerolineae bacterium]